MLFVFLRMLKWNSTLFIFVLVICTTYCKKEKSRLPEASKSMERDSTEVVFPFEPFYQNAGLRMAYHNDASKDYFLPEIMGGGIAFIDYNNDQYQDVLVVGGGHVLPQKKDSILGIRLFKNTKGSFSDVTQEMGLDKIRCYGFGLTVGDYDNDGDDDFFLATLRENYLFENRGDTFADVSAKAGVEGKNVWSTSSAFYDADNDGWLDLFVGNYVDWSPEFDRKAWCSINGNQDNYCIPTLYDGVAGYFYHNNGNGTFTEESEKRGIASHAPTKTLGVALMDYDNDFDMDLVVANDLEPDLLYQNSGDGNFKEVGIDAGMAYSPEGATQSGMGVVVGDVNRSGFETIFIGNFSRQQLSVFQNTPSGTFIDRSGSFRLAEPTLPTLTFGLSLFDVDLDGDLDLFAANGHLYQQIQTKFPNITYRQPQHLFINENRGKFRDIVPSSGSFLENRQLGRASAVADIDLDGDLDLIYTDNEGPIHVMKNVSENSNHFLRILIRGKQGNLNSIGASATAYFSDGTVQKRMVKSADGYLSQSEFPIVFGYSNNIKMDSLNIQWLSGTHQTFSDLTKDDFIQVSEGGNTYIQLPMKDSTH